MHKLMTPPRIQGVQEWLYVITVASLALYLIIGVIVWAWMILAGIPAPDAFSTILAAIGGALAGIVTPLQGPPSRSDDTSSRNEPPVE
jgi:Na+/H+ antiporter NhaA